MGRWYVVMDSTEIIDEFVVNADTFALERMMALAIAEQRHPTYRDYMKDGKWDDCSTFRFAYALGVTMTICQEDGLPPRAYLSLLDARAHAIADKIREWNCENIFELRRMIGELQNICIIRSSLGEQSRVSDYIDMAMLPSVEIPDSATIYPVWSCDKRGNCLVGDTLRIERLSDIMDYYAEKHKKCAETSEK